MSQSTTKRKRAELKKELSSFTVGLHNIDDILRKITKTKVDPEFLIIDLFCGAGGTSTGFSMAGNIAKVIACVNHDHLAIESHWVNHPYVAHFEEDIRTLNLEPLRQLVAFYRKLYPTAKVILWASLECTNHSKAKGGQSRDADSRTLADHLHRYILALNPDYVQIENVVEFKIWGPLTHKIITDENGCQSCKIEVKQEKVTTYNKRLRRYVEKKGAYVTTPVWVPIKERLAEDFNRWCGEINSLGYRNEWTELNSADFGAYTSRNRLFGCFAKPGLPIVFPSPTHSKKPMAQSNLFDKPLLPWKKVREVIDLADEGESIFSRKKDLCDNTLKVICKGIEKAIKEGESEFLFKYYGTGDNLNSINVPAGTIPTKDRFAKIKLILRDYKKGYSHSINQPIGTLPTVPKAHLLSFIFNPSHGGHCITTAHPCLTIVARQDKAPLSIIQVLMNEYGISDIKKRMLRVDELLKIQGFPDGYTLNGTQTDQKKFIGNSVVPVVVKSWAQAMAKAQPKNYIPQPLKIAA